MPRAEQTVAYSISPVVPTTAGRLPVFATTGNPSKATDSAYAQADAGHQIIVGVGASVNVAQVVGAPVVVLGENANAWGSGAIAIGLNTQAGQTAAKDGSIAIGNGVVSNGKNAIRIGSGLAFGVGAGDDAIAIGTQAGAVGNAGISIGRGALSNVNGVAIGKGASTNGTTEGVAIGTGATCANTGVNHLSIAIGNGANAGVNNGQSAIAIGNGATATHALASKLIAIGEGATINGNVTAAIALGAGATNPGSNEFLVGDAANGNHIAIVTFRSLAANPVRHRVGASGGWAIRDAGNANDIFLVDSSAVAGDIRLLLWDVTFGGLKRVTMAAAGAAPAAGFRALQVPV